MARVIVFDLNETLIDLSALDPEFQRVFGDRSAREEWFKQVLQLFLAATVIGQYQSFDKLAEAALKMIGAQRGTNISPADRQAISAKMSQLSAHPDVRPALVRLKDAGFRIVTLTNSSEKVARGHLERNDLSMFFDDVISADDVKRFKPAREVYEHAAKKLGVDFGDIRLVAAHSWDISGALAAGCKAAFVRRPKKVLNPDAEQPDIADDLEGVVSAILEKDG